MSLQSTLTPARATVFFHLPSSLATKAAYCFWSMSPGSAPLSLNHGRAAALVTLAGASPPRRSAGGLGGGVRGGGGGIEGDPGDGLGAGQALLGNGRNLGQRAAAGRRGHAQRLDAAVADIRRHRHHVMKQRRYLAGEQVGKRRRGTLVRHMGHRNAGFEPEQFARQMGGPANAGG